MPSIPPHLRQSASNPYSALFRGHNTQLMAFRTAFGRRRSDAMKKRSSSDEQQQHPYPPPYQGPIAAPSRPDHRTGRMLLSPRQIQLAPVHPQGIPSTYPWRAKRPGVADRPTLRPVPKRCQPPQPTPTITPSILSKSPPSARHLPATFAAIPRLTSNPPSIYNEPAPANAIAVSAQCHKRRRRCPKYCHIGLCD